MTMTAEQRDVMIVRLGAKIRDLSERFPAAGQELKEAVNQLAQTIEEAEAPA